MNDQDRIMLAVSARMLSYPSEPYWSELLELQEIIREFLEPGAGKTAFSAALSPFFAFSLTEAQELYVETFDWKEKAGLYLTAHELGDSRKRGVALAELQQLIWQMGFELPDAELPDYIPMLLELLAAAEPAPQMERLARRLAFAVMRILSHLPPENVYSPVFELLTETVFAGYKGEDLSELERDREHADLEELPYPLMYG